MPVSSQAPTSSHRHGREHHSHRVLASAPAFLDGGTLTGYTASAFPGSAACTTRDATSCTLTGLANGISTYNITVSRPHHRR